MGFPALTFGYRGVSGTIKLPATTAIQPFGFLWGFVAEVRTITDAGVLTQETTAQIALQDTETVVVVFQEPETIVVTLQEPLTIVVPTT